MALACKQANVKHVIWSTLDNTEEVLRGNAPMIRGIKKKV